MFEEEFEKLTSADQNIFRSVIASLMTHTFILRNTPDFSSGSIARTNDEYIFAYRNLEMISDYLSFAGYKVDKDEHYGIIYLSDFPEGTKVRFDKLSTLVLYVLRLIYEEEREKLTLGTEVPYSVLDLNQKLISLGITKDNKPLPAYQLREILSRIARYRIIAKDQGAWDNYMTRFVIFPSILLVMDSARLNELEALVAEKSRESDTEAEESEA